MKFCPHPEVHRSRRRWWEWPFSLLVRVRPYRCALCQKRMWRYRGRLWVDLPILLLAGAASWFWWQGTRVVPDAALQPLPLNAQAMLASPERATPAPLVAAAETEPATPEAVPATLRLLDLRVLAEPRQFRLIVEYQGAQLKPQLYQLDSPPRMVLDLPGAWQLSARQLAPQRSGGDLVEQVRLGDRAGALRVVLDLRDSTELATRLREEPGRLELRLNRAS